MIKRIVPMEVTLLGTVMDVSNLQLAKVPSADDVMIIAIMVISNYMVPIAVTEVGIATDVSDVCEKAYLPNNDSNGS